MKKTFALRVLLSITTGRLLTERRGPNDNGIGDLYEILNHMTRDNLFIHQLPRAVKECSPWLLRWFPELVPVGNGSTLDKWLKMDNTYAFGSEAIKMWITELKMMFPEIKDEYEVEPIPADDHDRIDPYNELVQMQGTDEDIILIDGTTE